MNDLDRIYQEYKQGIKPVPEKRPPSRKGIGPQGVPDPVFDSNFESDFSKVNSCPKCGSMNLSVDMSTNKATCRDCNEKPDAPKKIDFQRQMEQAQEEEFDEMKKATDLGHTFNM